jgi:hypothetical protein
VAIRYRMPVFSPVVLEEDSAAVLHITHWEKLDKASIQHPIHNKMRDISKRIIR